MRILLHFIVLGFVFTTPVVAQPPAPATRAPEVWLGTATERGGKVNIQLTTLQQVHATEFDGRRHINTLEVVWGETRNFELGTKIKAYRMDGQEATSEEVLEALSKPIAVAVFINEKREPVTPDPFYLSVLRPDCVALLVDARTLATPGN